MKLINKEVICGHELDSLPQTRSLKAVLKKNTNLCLVFL